MSYNFKGRLCGYICDRCLEPLSRVKIRLYRIGQGRDVTTLAVAAPKDTFAILTDQQVKEKQHLLIAEVESDEEGNFFFELDKQHRYNGEPFEIDIYCASVPPHEQTPHDSQPLQFSVTTLQPLWREREGGFLFGWEYCIPARLWCFIRGRFGVWAICGRVTICDQGRDTHRPVPNVRVKASDVDWFQDDALGSAITDAGGNFRIYYTPQNFRVTPFSPFINLECVGGPDIYFRVETLIGSVLLDEPRSAGRTPQRENRGPCTCVDLCIDLDKDLDPIDPTLSVFDKIGGYNFLTQIDSGAGGDGLTLADNRAFFSTLRLNGIVSKTKNGNPLEYAFDVAAYDPTTDVLGPYTQISLAQIAPTEIGTWQRLTASGIVETKPYVLNGGGPEVLVPAVSPDGWVRVPQESNARAAEGNFVPSVSAYPGLINLKSETLRTFGTINASAVQAGESGGPPNADAGRDFYYSLRMKVRETIRGVPVPGSEEFTGTCVRLAVMNTLYNNVSKNGSWNRRIVDRELGLASLDIQELADAGCAEITRSLTVKYTAAHPNLGSVLIWMDGPGGPYAFTLAAGGTPENRFGVATNRFTLASLRDCAYIVKLSAPLLLTTGDSTPGALTDEVAICKNTRVYPADPPKVDRSPT